MFHQKKEKKKTHPHVAIHARKYAGSPPFSSRE